MNKPKIQTKNSGFTIIEVVLVLAIAGLIFLMVFLALPALQRSQRDTQRKEDLSRINTQLGNYTSSSRGAVPTAANLSTAFIAKYITPQQTEYVDPSGPNYTITFNNSNLTGTQVQSLAFGTVYYATTTKCDDTSPGDVTSTGANARNYTLRTKLENQTALYCLDNR